MIRFQLFRADKTGDAMLAVGTVTAPPAVTYLNLTQSAIDVPYEEWEKIVKTLNMGAASVFKAYAEVIFKDTVDKDGAPAKRIVKADATVLKGLRK